MANMQVGAVNYCFLEEDAMTATDDSLALIPTAKAIMEKIALAEAEKASE
jgi:hypothetical protein